MPSPLPSRVRADLFSQLAAMEKAGLPADRAWGLLQLPSVPAARLQAVRSALVRGANLAIAAQKARLFTPLEASLVGAALAAGSPAHAYQRLADSCAQKAQNTARLRSRLLLPAAMLVLALLIQPLAQLISGTLSVGGYLLQVLRPLLAVVALVFLVGRIKASLQASRWLLKLPVYGHAMVRENARHFFESLALLLEAGVPMFEALPTAVATIENPEIRQAYAHIKPRMQAGVPLSNALGEAMAEPVYLGNPQVIERIATGEASGTLPEMLFQHVSAEAESLKQFWTQCADWTPRIAYLAVAIWMAYGLLTGGFG